MVGAVKEYERGLVLPLCKPFHATDEDQMVSAGVLRFLCTFEPSATAVDQWRVVDSTVHGNVGEAVFGARREAIGQVALAGRKYIDRIALCATECFEFRRVGGEAPQDERRVQ